MVNGHWSKTITFFFHRKFAVGLGLWLHWRSAGSHHGQTEAVVQRKPDQNLLLHATFCSLCIHYSLLGNQTEVIGGLINLTAFFTSSTLCAMPHCVRQTESGHWCLFEMINIKSLWFVQYLSRNSSGTEMTRIPPCYRLVNLGCKRLYYQYSLWDTQALTQWPYIILDMQPFPRIIDLNV